MDPNATLREMLELSAELLRDADTIDDALGKAERLAELTIALDQWIVRGGFLPSKWKR